MLHVFVLIYWISLDTAHFWDSGVDKYCGPFSGSHIEVMANTLQSTLLGIMPVLGLVTWLLALTCSRQHLPQKQGHVGWVENRSRSDSRMVTDKSIAQVRSSDQMWPEANVLTFCWID